MGELGIYPNRIDYEYSLQINEQIKLYTTTDSNAVLIKSSDLDNKGYNGHFGSDSQRTFGLRFAEGYIRYEKSQSNVED